MLSAAQISVGNSDIAYLADYTVDIEGMDFFYEIELILPTVPTRHFIPTTPKPVELVSFTPEAKSGKVILNWHSSTEVNNYEFDIHGRANDDEWVTLGFIDGHRNSNSPKRYNFTDSNLTGGSKFSYRLKQIDNDGTYEYSEIVGVEFDLTEFALYQNYPNPINPNTLKKYQIPELSFVTLKIYDVLGSEVIILINEEKQVGSYDVEFNAKALSSGIYFFKLQAGNFVETKKMVMMK